jgi:hypothetical protein
VRSLRVYPPLVVWLRWSFTLLGAAIATVTVIDIGADLLARRPIDFPALHYPGRTFAALTFVAVCLALFLFAIFWSWAATLEPHGLRGFTSSGRRVYIPWSDVASIDHASVSGVPSFVVASAASRKKIWMCALGLDAAPLRQYLQTYAGPDHILTQWFTPPTA